MKKYLIDTNIVSYLADRHSPFHENIRRHFKSLQKEDDVVLSILSVYELYYSISKANTSLDPNIIRTKEETCTEFPIVPLTHTGARVFADIKSKYQKKYNLPKTALARDTIDLMIASSAIAEGCTLVSNDKIFHDLKLLMPELKTENWTV
jgi:predicted nucleic acid-binding protein